MCGVAKAPPVNEFPVEGYRGAGVISPVRSCGRALPSLPLPKDAWSRAELTAEPRNALSAAIAPAPKPELRSYSPNTPQPEIFSAIRRRRENFDCLEMPFRGDLGGFKQRLSSRRVIPFFNEVVDSC